MPPQRINLKRTIPLTLIILLVTVFASVFISPVVHADGTGGILPPNYNTDTTTVSSVGDAPVISDESTSETASYSLWDAIVDAVDALI